MCLDLPQPIPHHASQSYKFGYSIKDHHGEQRREESGNEGHAVRGRYAFTDPRGIRREVHYISDFISRFRAQVKTNEPGTTNQNPASVHLISDAPYAHGEYAGASRLGYTGLGNAGYGGLGYAGYGGYGLGYGGYGPGYGGYGPGYGGYDLGYGGYGPGYGGYGPGYGGYDLGYGGYDLGYGGYGSGYGGNGLGILGGLGYARYGF
ncbi:cuticle protein 16.8 [Trichonephila inaurata madagascariensis]|uniref:Cuticle protein 16.8 n=1 Tax=Trichonephila inaurata madagascariensis TaxID=2747483 RepID=A0A8X6YC10_9ARAC|nr:cuticle protein 16.8 [Trichonephila inaurata madagascariensis]